MNRKSAISEFMVPLSATKSGHLVFLSDVDWVTILTGLPLPELVRGSFEYVLPRVRVEKDAIVIEYRDLLTLKKREDAQTPVGSIILNPSVPWEVEFRGQASNLIADLRGLELQSLDLLGGARQAELSFPHPIQTSFIYVPGGIEDSVIHIPAGVGIRLRVNGPVKHLFFDNQYFDASGEKFGRENAAFKDADSHYAICITGGIRNVTIDELPSDAPSDDGDLVPRLARQAHDDVAPTGRHRDEWRQLAEPPQDQEGGARGSPDLNGDNAGMCSRMTEHASQRLINRDGESSADQRCE